MPIFDQGYQHWNGPLSGHAWRWLAVARHGIRATLKNRFVRLFLFVAWMPAVALVAALAVWGLLEQQSESILAFLRPILPTAMIGKPQDFRAPIWTVLFSFFFKAELAVALFLVMVVGPTLVSRDLRFNAFPLYFARPLRRIDYFAGKLGVIGFFLAATQVVPAVVAYLVGVAFSLDINVVRDTHRLLWAGALYGLVITVSAGTLMLALSSLSRRSIYVAIAWAGFVFLTLMVSGILIIIHKESERDYVVREGITKWVEENPPPAGIEMSGPYPIFRGPQRWMSERPVDPPLTEEEREKKRWFRDWSTAQRRLRDQAAASRFEDNRTDWRPIVSYATNLDRIGDWLLDTDAAWVALGRAVERPRAMIGPIAQMQAGGRLPRELTQPANDRMVADRLVWQYPWTWSAGVLGGLWLVSVLVLSSRVKSLDRLK
ncbi:MAG: hypothetical protein U0746_17790 [Gemmataceae bacterium]